MRCALADALTQPNRNRCRQATIRTYSPADSIQSRQRGHGVPASNGDRVAPAPLLHSMRTRHPRPRAAGSLLRCCNRLIPALGHGTVESSFRVEASALRPSARTLALDDQRARRSGLPDACFALAKEACAHDLHRLSSIVQRRRLVGVGEDDGIEADAVVSGDVGETPAQDDPLVRWIARADSHSRRRKRVSFVLCNGVGLVDPARGPARVGSGFAHGRKCSRGADSPGVRGRHLATCPVWSVFTQWMPWPSVALTVAGGGRCSSARRAMSSAS